MGKYVIERKYYFCIESEELNIIKSDIKYVIRHKG